jgi:hypothetical protein
VDPDLRIGCDRRRRRGFVAYDAVISALQL